jgi:hypothetical protein
LFDARLFHENVCGFISFFVSLFISPIELVSPIELLPIFEEL